MVSLTTVVSRMVVVTLLVFVQEIKEQSNKMIRPVKVNFMSTVI